MRCTSRWTTTALAIALAAFAAEKQALPAAPSDKPLPADDKASAERLILDLGSDDYRTREKAGRELGALGEKVLPQMRAALANAESPEVQRRLVALVRKMDYDRLVTPKLVKLSLKDKTANDTFAEIAKQTGYKIDYVGSGMGVEPKHSFEFDGIPFWQAVDKVANAVGCTAFNEMGDDSIQVYNQDTTNPHVSYVGPYRFLANNISSNKTVQLSGINRRGAVPSRQEFLNLNFQIQSEPKNPMLGITQVELLSATDDMGGSLLPPRDPNNRVNYYANNIGRGHSCYGGVNLNRSDKSATSIKSLKAKVGIILLSGSVPEIAVADPLKVAKKHFTGRTMEIEIVAFTENPAQKGHYLLELTVRKIEPVNPNRPGEDLNWMNCAWQKVEVVDEAGNRLHTNGPTNFDNDGTTIQLTIPYEPANARNGPATKIGPPVKLVFNEWLSVVHEVAFEFKDIPLP